MRHYFIVGVYDIGIAHLANRVASTLWAIPVSSVANMPTPTISPDSFLIGMDTTNARLVIRPAYQGLERQRRAVTGIAEPLPVAIVEQSGIVIPRHIHAVQVSGADQVHMGKSGCHGLECRPLSPGSMLTISGWLTSCLRALMLRSSHTDVLVTSAEREACSRSAASCPSKVPP